eukprot:gnl/Hemi2/10398_TR3588_c0_g2_i1.p1 gnl/Hemi2/10398_TR3588_c0_g2~~gnl/Hemi2/10398_TR3588_c0_g2_i1.p1  ORF type:complete len:507 (-),score=94.06 gnl/Hemi2/10398_TR3588_c0_g2_i1:63-1583(-)
MGSEERFDKDELRFRNEMARMLQTPKHSLMPDREIEEIKEERAQRIQLGDLNSRQADRDRRATKTSKVQVLHYVEQEGEAARVGAVNDIVYNAYSGYGTCESVPMFDKYQSNDSFRVRREGLRRFLLAVYRVVVQHRVIRRTHAIRAKFQLAKGRGRKEKHVVAISPVGHKQEEGEFFIAIDLINPYRFSRYVPTRTQVYKSVDVSTYHSSEELVLCTLTEPQEFKLLGYRPHPLPIIGTYPSIEEKRALREGASEEHSVRSMHEVKAGPFAKAADEAKSSSASKSAAAAAASAAEVSIISVVNKRLCAPPRPTIIPSDKIRHYVPMAPIVETDPGYHLLPARRTPSVPTDEYSVPSITLSMTLSDLPDLLPQIRDTHSILTCSLPPLMKGPQEQDLMKDVADEEEADAIIAGKLARVDPTVPVVTSVESIVATRQQQLIGHEMGRRRQNLRNLITKRNDASDLFDGATTGARNITTPTQIKRPRLAPRPSHAAAPHLPKDDSVAA